MKRKLIYSAISVILLTVANAAYADTTLSIEKMTENQQSSIKKPDVKANDTKVQDAAKTKPSATSSESAISLQMVNHTAQIKDVNPFYGSAHDLSSKTEKLTQLTMDEQIVAKQLAISRLEAEIKSLSKPKPAIPMSPSAAPNSLEAGFNQAIKKTNTASKKTKPSVVSSKPMNLPPSLVNQVTMPVPSQSNVLYSIVENDNERYAMVRDTNGKLVQLKSGDTLDGKAVTVNDDSVSVGDKTLVMRDISNLYKNPDAQKLAADTSSLGGKPASLFPSKEVVNFPENVNMPKPQGL